jgi:hypothetical protein
MKTRRLAVETSGATHGGASDMATKKAQHTARLTKAALSKSAELIDLLAELMERIHDEADITNGGGPNLAMRLETEFGPRVDAILDGLNEGAES